MFNEKIMELVTVNREQQNPLNLIHFISIPSLWLCNARIPFSHPKFLKIHEQKDKNYL